MEKFLPRCLHYDEVKLHGVDGVFHAPGVVLQRTRQERLPHRETTWEREPPENNKIFDTHRARCKYYSCGNVTVKRAAVGSEFETNEEVEL